MSDRAFGGGRYTTDHPILQDVFARLLPARGHSVVFWCHDGRPRWRSDRQPWFDAVVDLMPTVPAWPGQAIGNTVSRLVRLLVRRGRVRRHTDVVVVRNDWLFAWVAARWLRLPILFQWSFPHEYLAEAQIADGLARWPLMTRIRGRLVAFGVGRAMRAATHILPISQWMRDELAERGVPLSKMTPLPLSAPVLARPPAAEVQALRRRMGLEDRPVVLYFGDMGRIRRLEFLIDAFADVRRDVPDAVLVMVGAAEAADVEALRLRARALGVDQALMVPGGVPRREVTTFAAAADVGVSPIRPIPLYRVSSPTKVLEMLAAGCAVVANDIPEQRALLEASGGGLCVPYDPRTFAAAIVDLLRDPQRRAEMGDRGRRYVSSHQNLESLATIVEQIAAGHAFAEGLR